MRKGLAKFLGIILLASLCSDVAAQSETDESVADTRTRGIISGRVVDENGQPFHNISVFIQSKDWKNFPSRTTTTDREGRFQVTGLDPALYYVAARAPTYVFLRHDLTSQPSYYRIGDSVTITLVKGGVITGTVSSASGEPLVRIGVNAILIQDVNGQKYASKTGVTLTDDRGVYRIYGLLPGTYLVAAGGRDSFNSYGESTAYDTDTPTFAPSSTSDTATEVIVRGGEETSGVDIRHRAEPGHVVSGTVNKPKGPNGIYPDARVTLTPISNAFGFAGAGSQEASQSAGNKGFLFLNVADGDYALFAMSAMEPGSNEVAISEAKRITVKGGDVTGIELITSPLGSISGRLVLENSNALSCKSKRKPVFAETLISAKFGSQESQSGQLMRQLSSFRSEVPDKVGDFSFSYLVPGRYTFGLQFFAKYWYLQAITIPASPTEMVPGKAKPTTKAADAASNWVNLKSGDRLTGLSIRLAEGAASLQGKVTTIQDGKLPERLWVHLVPVEPNKAEDVLRFYADKVKEDGSFDVGNVAPGRYWAIARVASEEALNPSDIRRPDQTEVRRRLRRGAENNSHLIELTPCQNLSGVKVKM